MDVAFEIYFSVFVHAEEWHGETEASFSRRGLFEECPDCSLVVLNSFHMFESHSCASVLYPLHTHRGLLRIVFGDEKQAKDG